MYGDMQREPTTHFFNSNFSHFTSTTDYLSMGSPETAIAAAAKNPHVAVLAFPFGTHAAPLLGVVEYLATASPNTLFSFFTTLKCIDSIFSPSPSPSHSNIRACEVWDGVEEGYMWVGKPQEEIELFMDAAPRSFREGLEVAVAETGRKFTCLVTDAFFWFAAEMAAELEVHWVAFWSAGPCSLSAHLYTDLLRQSLSNSVEIAGGGSNEDEALKEIIPGMSKIRVRDLPEGVVSGNLTSFFSTMLLQMSHSLPNSSAIFINSFHHLDPQITSDLTTHFNNLLCIGPFNLISPKSQDPDAYGCVPWLHTQAEASVAYISFGSVITPPSHELVALAEALEATKVPFIWSMKDSGRLPDGFLETTKLQGKVVAWAPQLQVLGHRAVGVFITHCGWNSVMESISLGEGGVPLICRPFFGDQRLNGRMVEEVWEIGMQVEGGVFTKTGVIDCLHQIFSGEKGRKLRKNVRALNELAKMAVRNNHGSSIKNLCGLSQLISSSQK